MTLSVLVCIVVGIVAEQILHFVQDDTEEGSGYQVSDFRSMEKT